MKTLLAVTIAFVSFSTFANVNCNSLVSDDSVVLCKQNKKILRKLRNLESSDLKACTVTYCTFQGKVETRAQYTMYCKEYNVQNWALRDHLVEARNRAHAREVFEESGLEPYTSGGSMTNAFISANCN